jgi:hypothetical protein
MKKAKKAKKAKETKEAGCANAQRRPSSLIEPRFYRKSGSDYFSFRSRFCCRPPRGKSTAVEFNQCRLF